MSAKEPKSDQQIRVYVRQRPLTGSEIELKRPLIVRHVTSSEVVLKAGNTEKKYTFDYVFDHSKTQDEVYDVVVKPLVKYSLDGYTCTAFAYGQTGTGKTYTMIGTDSPQFYENPSAGMIPRAAIELFEELQSRRIGYHVSVSFIEIYNEEVRDLLVSDGVILKLYDDPLNRGSTCIKGVSEVRALNWEKVYDLLAIGQAERQTAATNLNRQSSRSHTIFTISITTEEIRTNGEEVVKTGKLNLIDLAGSENIGRSGATDVRAREAGSINKSLLTLGKVIKALAKGMPHVPYRESKLTRILQDSLGGKSKTCIIATFAPCINEFDETVSTLDYAHMARNVTNSPQVNVKVNQTKFVENLQNKIGQMRMDLAAARAGEGFYVDHNSYQNITTELEQQEHRMACLRLELETLENHSLSQEKKNTELNRNCLEVKRKAEEVEAELKARIEKHEENQFVIEHMHKSVDELKETATDLLNICETSTKYQDVYYNKHNALCESAMRNAQIGRVISSTASECLPEIVNCSKSYSDNLDRNLTQATQAYNNIKDNELNENKSIEDFLLQMQDLLKESNYTFESVFKDGRYDRQAIKNLLVAFRDNIAQDQETQRATVEIIIHNLDEYIGTKSIDINERISRDCSLVDNNLEQSENIFLQLHPELSQIYNNITDRIITIENEKRQIHEQKLFYSRCLAAAKAKSESTKNKLSMTRDNLCRVEALINVLSDNKNSLAAVKDTLKDFSGIIGTVKDFSKVIGDKMPTIKDSHSAAIEVLRYNGRQTTDKISEVCDAFHEQRVTYFEDLGQRVESLNDEMNQTNKQMNNQLDKECRVVNNALDELNSLHKTYESDLEQFIQSTDKKISSQVQHVDTAIHTGDTPVKVDYRFPESIENSLPRDLLKEKFKLQRQQLKQDEGQREEHNGGEAQATDS